MHISGIFLAFCHGQPKPQDQPWFWTLWTFDCFLTHFNISVLTGPSTYFHVLKPKPNRYWTCTYGSVFGPSFESHTKKLVPYGWVPVLDRSHPYYQESNPRAPTQMQTYARGNKYAFIKIDIQVVLCRAFSMMMLPKNYKGSKYIWSCNR